MNEVWSKRIGVALTVMTLGAIAYAQEAPVVDMASLLSVPFNTSSGALAVRDVKAANVPRGANVELVVERDGNETQRIRMQHGVARAPYSNLRTGITHPVNAGEPGHYELRIEVGGQVAGELEFDVAAGEAGRTRSGPWTELAYFERAHGRDDGNLSLCLWVARHELDGAREVDFALRKGRRQRARLRQPFRARRDHYDLNCARFWLEDEERYLKMSDLSRGGWSVDLLKAGESRPVRSYDFQVGASGIEPHARSSAAEPQQRLLTSGIDGNDGAADQLDRWWIGG